MEKEEAVKIVIVEDEAEIRNVLENVLARISPDYEVAGTASDGRAGLALIRRTRPDLVILDICMPDMDGLSMLKELRDEGNRCRAVVLSAYSDFDYAKRAIELNVESYLLKPLKIPELQNALRSAEEHIRREKKEKARYTPTWAFLSALAGEKHPDTYIAEYLKEEYGLLADGLTGIFIVWLGGDCKKYSDSVYQALEPLGDSGLFSVCVLKREKRQLVLAALYDVRDRDGTADYLRKVAVPMLAGLTGQKAVMGLIFCGGIGEFHEAAIQLCDVLDYSLTEGTGRLIVYEERDNGTVAFKYPLELETRTKQAVVQKNDEEVRRCIRTFFATCRNGRFRPDEVKNGCFRFFDAVCHTARECGLISISVSDISGRMKMITEAVTWEQIQEIFAVFTELPDERKISAEPEGKSLLVRRAGKMIREYYSQGITLEEIAAKLGVSEEYLSTRLKKETGSTFTEIIRQVRIERIKELLISTNMKLNQIADAAGYADPKYMSRIFKEEVGMLPLEYRKIHL